MIGLALARYAAARQQAEHNRYVEAQKYQAWLTRAPRYDAPSSIPKVKRGEPS